MVKKELETLLVMVKANEEAVRDAVEKFSYTYDIVCDMIEVYNYIINSLEENVVVIPPNFKKINISNYENEVKKAYEIICYRSGFLALVIKEEIKKIEEKDVFDDLEKFEKNQNKHILEKISLLEDEIKEYEFEIKNFEDEIIELEAQLEKIIAMARDKKCDNSNVLKEVANTDLDIKKAILKIEKVEREIDKRKENVSRKKNEISILEFQLKTSNNV